MKDFSVAVLLETITPYLVSIASKLVAALLILIIGFKLAKIVVRSFGKSKAIAKLDAGVASFLQNFLSIGLKALILVTVAGLIGIPMTSFITILGSVAVAVGLSLQGSLSNVAGGILILVCKPFVIGDFISAAGNDGVVTDIGLFYTQLTTGDNRKIIIPNSVISSNTIINVTHQTTRRVDMDITVAYDTDIEKAKSILLELANRHPLVEKEPNAPMARIASHGDNALVFTFRVWCKTDDYWTVRFDLLEAVKEAFDSNHISIPFPQLDVHMDK